jgi:RNA polymerase sigma-70 factor (ECF subfamily)
VTSQVEDVITRLRAEQWTRVVAATARVGRDLDLAEDCVQDAFVQALKTWPRDGLPRNPEAWLMTVACRRALELRHRSAILRDKLPLLVEPDSPTACDAPIGRGDADAFRWMPDDTLRLVFTCAHPALAPDARVALTLRLVCGLQSEAIAGCFLVSRPTMQARITRAKKKITHAGIPYRVPQAADLPGRLDAVLDTLHLLYTAGHAAGAGPALARQDLTQQAVRLARLVHELLPDQRETAGLLALFLLSEARQAARTSQDGRFVPLQEQDRTRWDRALLAEGIELTHDGLRGGQPGRYALMAAIAAVHAEAPSWQLTDWQEIVGLYDVLLARWPSPIVQLNRAVAIGFRDGPRTALALLDELSETESALAAYPYLYAAKARFQTEVGQREKASASLEEAIALAGNDVERDHLARQLEEL